MPEAFELPEWDSCPETERQVWTGMPDRFLQGFSGSLTLDDRSSMTVDSSPLRY
jgi:hypothetical protein